MIRFSCPHCQSALIGVLALAAIGCGSQPPVTTRPSVQTEFTKPTVPSTVAEKQPTKPAVDPANPGFSKRTEPTSASFVDVLNFPEEYVGKTLKFGGVWLHGDFERDKERGLFSMTVSDAAGKRASPDIYPKKKDLSFIMREDFGRRLSIELGGNKKTKVNLYCDIGMIQGSPLARIYKIETFNLNGDVLDTHEDR